MLIVLSTPFDKIPNSFVPKINNNLYNNLNTDDCGSHLKLTSNKPRNQKRIEALPKSISYSFSNSSNSCFFQSSNTHFFSLLRCRNCLKFLRKFNLFNLVSYIPAVNNISDIRQFHYKGIWPILSNVFFYFRIG
jgi:hypothetical protein